MYEIHEYACRNQLFSRNTTLSKLLGSNVTHYLRVMYLAHENHTNI